MLCRLRSDRRMGVGRICLWGGSGVWTCHILQADRTVASRRPYYVAWSLVWTRTVGTLTCVDELVLLVLPSAFVLPPPVQTTRFHVYCPRSLSQAFGNPIPSCWVYPTHEYPANTQPSVSCWRSDLGRPPRGLAQATAWSQSISPLTWVEDTGTLNNERPAPS